MALNIKNDEVERLAAALAERGRTSKTEAVRSALEARLDVVREGSGLGRAERLRRLLEHDVWPFLPEELLGTRVGRVERERILGYGPEGV